MGGKEEGGASEGLRSSWEEVWRRICRFGWRRERRMGMVVDGMA